MRRANLSWLCSLLLHTGLMIGLALWLTPNAPQSPGTPSAGTERPVSIVVRPSAAERPEFSRESSSPAPESRSSQAAFKPAFSFSAKDSPADVAPRSLDEALPGPAQSPTGAAFPRRAPSLPPASAAETSDARRLTDQLGTAKGRGGLDAEQVANLIAADRAAQRSRQRVRVGPPATLRLFDSPPARGHRFAFVIDRSKSMGSEGLGALAAAREQLITQLSTLTENHEFQIVAYHHATTMLGPRRLRAAERETLAELPDFFDRLGAFGGTDHETALHVSLTLEPDIIFLLTDGQQPKLEFSALRELSQRAQGQTAIYCLQFGAGSEAPQNSWMQRLAELTGGGYRYVQLR